MSSLVPPADIDAILASVEAAPSIGRLRELMDDGAEAGPDILRAVLEEASRFAEGVLAPLNVTADRAGCRLQDGRVRTAPGHAEAWRAYVDAGWLGIDQPPEIGGQGLPLVALAACTEVFDRANVAFGMLPTGQRAAGRLIAAHAEEAIKAEWLPRLVSGEWAATICISEPEAGSDVGRIRTLADPQPDGAWRITGEKIWISYGDHDLAGRIGHCLLARTPGAPPGAAGLSLFLVPDVLEDGRRNAIVVRRIEEKLGLHGSPTCALGLEGAHGRLIGSPGRGLAHIFTMISTMRLMVSVQGLALAGAAADVALAYAQERRQGGPSDAPAVPIIEHPDVRRMLLGLAGRAHALRGLVFAAAVQADLGRIETDPDAREDAQALAGWLLPIAKTLAAEAAFDGASEALQVLGGAGYVKDWPVEQMLRDSRVFAVFEGASGIQALDLLARRLRRDGGRGLEVFLRLARADAERLGGRQDDDAARLAGVLDLLAEAGARLGRESGVEAAYPFLKLAGAAALGWSALRLGALPLSGPAGRRLAAASRFALSELAIAAASEHARTRLPADRLALLDDLLAR